MVTERARVRAVQKPWGSTDLRPWSGVDMNGHAIGELWYQRAGTDAPDPALLLKLLFTTAPLSIQVHPNDHVARSMGLSQGKTEAWYVLTATADAKVALGLKRPLSQAELRQAIQDGSIAELVQWHRVEPDDFIFVPSGTIHALGAGLVVAEVQQNSDTTFRLFDYGRSREIHLEHAVAAANLEPPACHPAHTRVHGAVTRLASNAFFAIARLDLPRDAASPLRAERETWLLVLDGAARVGSLTAVAGEAIFLESADTTVTAGAAGLAALLASVAAKQLPNQCDNPDQPMEEQSWPT